MYRYEYFRAFGDIDTLVGMIPVAMVIVGACGASILVWMKHTRRYAPFSAALAALVVLSVALFPTALRGDWWMNLSISEGQGERPDIAVFTPFSESSKTAKLGAASSLTLHSDFPVLDGAIALYPVYAAFAEAVYDPRFFSHEYVLCTNTRNAYKTLLSGERDIIFIADASRSQAASAEAAGVNTHFTPIGREAFVFLVGKENPVNTITYQQIQNIYSGKTGNWKTLGWKEGGGIIAFQRPEGSGSQTGLQNIMGKLPIQSPQPLPDAGLNETNSLMRQISVEWRGVQPALGYSYRYYATKMYANPETKLLRINGVAPSRENIQNGSYPFVVDFYAVTNGEPKGNAKRLIDWILSPQGQEIIEKTGYTPIR